MSLRLSLAFYLLLFYLSSWAVQFAEADLTVSNPCTERWTGPSSTNTIQCDGDDIVEWVNSIVTVLVLAGLPLVIGFFLMCPCCCCILGSRYCCKCCGSHMMRPGHCCCGGSELDMRPEGDLIRMYSKGGIIFTKAMAVVVAIMGVVAVILCFVGGTKISSGLQDVPNSLTSLANWALDLIQQVQTSLRDPNTNAYPSQFDGSILSDLQNTIRDHRDDILRDFVNPYDDPMKKGTTIPAFITILPCLVLLLVPLAAFCNIRSVLPLVVVMASFPLQFVYLTVASLLIIVLIPINIICDDITASPGQRSIIQWLLIPQCDAHLPFDSFVDNINEMETSAASEGCQSLLEFCSPSQTYDSSHPDIVFVCAGLTNPSTQCTSLSSLQSYTDALFIKTGAPETCGGEASTCNLQKCATQCDYTTARTNAADAVSSLNAAIRVKNTYTNLIQPWMSCQRLIDKVRTSGPTQACDALQGGLGALKNGALVIGVALIVAIFVSLLGQKRFINQSAHKLFADTDSSDPLAQPMQQMPPIMLAAMQTHGGATVGQLPATQHSYYVSAPVPGQPQQYQQQQQQEPHPHGNFYQSYPSPQPYQQQGNKQEPPLVSVVTNINDTRGREAEVEITLDDPPHKSVDDDGSYRYEPIAVPKKEGMGSESDF